jgi:hemolysin activation/secretion protein
LLLVLVAALASVAEAAPVSGAKIAADDQGNDTAKPDQARPDQAKPEVGKSDAAKTDSGKTGDGKTDAAAAKVVAPPFDIDEYRVEGADSLPQIDVEEAVYPFLGPKRTADDVEKARAALEKAYHDRGYQTVSVSIPQQKATRGFVVLKVAENRVGQLRVKGSRYFDLDTIKHKATSLKEGKLPNFNDVTKDIVALNQWPDRRVTPALRAGAAPGTVDVDLNVEDNVPMHGSAEFNNRQSASTTALRFTATAHYDDLWQLGHSLSATYQVAPERPKDAEVYSVSYLARTNLDSLNILVYGLNSASSVATVGGANVVGPGTVVGVRGVITLPTSGQLFQTLSLGVDYKDFGESLTEGSSSFSTPVTYYPAVASYGGTWRGDKDLIQLNATITAGLRGLGSDSTEFDNKRFKATESFISLRSDLSYTYDFPDGSQLFLKGQGQISDQPLVSSEQLSIGGLDTVRGYLESEALGDFGGNATVEVRSPSFGPAFTQTVKDPAKGQPEKFSPVDEWRVFAFGDAGRVQIFDPLPQQQEVFDLASFGMGTSFKIMKYSNGVVLVAVPLISQQVTVANKPRVSFRFWGEF